MTAQHAGRRHLALISCAAALLGSSELALAQDGEEVVVTAQRRSSTVERTPASISALSSAELQERGIDDVREIQFAVPSVTVGKNLGNLNIAIRGVGQDVGLPATSVNIDGVYQPRSVSQETALVDLQRVEVLRGPQGTLYGRNANAGAINFVTVEPTDTFEGWLQVGYATFDEASVKGVVNIPIAEGVRARISASYSDRKDGFIENIAGGLDMNSGESMAGRARLVMDLSEDFTVDLAFGAFRRDGAFDYIIYSTPYAASVVAANPILNSAIYPQHPWETSSQGPSNSDREGNATSLTAEWRTSFATFKSVSAYQEVDVEWHDDRDGTNVNFVRGFQKEKSETFTEEFTVSGQSDAFDWVGGVFYMDDNASSELTIDLPSGLRPLPAGAFIERVTPRTDTEALGIFADVTWNLTDSLRLLGGVRYSEDEIEVTNRRRIGLHLPTTDITVASLCPITENSVDFSSTTYRVGVQYDVAEKQNLYGTVSSGFKSGGVNLNGCNDTYEPEEITAYELGYKARFAGDTVSLRTSAFYYDYSNFQVAQVVGLAVLITNAAAAEVKGLEAELSWTPDEHWSLGASVAFLDATYETFSNVDSLNPSLGVQDLSGNRLNNAPETSGTFSIAYATDEEDWGSLAFRLDASARSRIYFREFNTPADSQSSYALLNASVTWRSPDGQTSLRLFGTNLTDEDYYTLLLATDALGARGGTYGDPRQIGIELRQNF